jgi:RimJ/RimL family protein N-acetyltransferase
VPTEPGTTLSIDELLLRPWRPEDAPALLVACQDPDIARWVAMPQPFLAADADAFIQDALTMWRDGTGAAFAVVEAASDRLLGAATRFGPDEHTSTFGCWVAPDARGRAVGRRALGQLADWTFATTTTIRIDGYIMVGNDASERMVEKLGWQREGVLRAWHVHPDGTPVDCVVYSLLRSDPRPARAM